MKKVLKGIINIYEEDKLGNKAICLSFERGNFNSWKEGMKQCEREATHLCKDFHRYTGLSYKHEVQLNYVELF